MIVMLMAIAGFAHAKEDHSDDFVNLPCIAPVSPVFGDVEIAEQEFEFGGLYTTDGFPGLTVVASVLYRRHEDHMHVCGMTARFPEPKRVSHCLPTGACPPGEPIIIDFIEPVGDNGYPLENYEGSIPFKSVAVAVHVQGHDGGNYKDYREYWSECTAAGNCPTDPSISWSSIYRHVDVTYHRESAAEMDLLTWVGETPTQEFADKCACEPKARFAASRLHYSQNDCKKKYGRFWAEDKFEIQDTFLNQPSLKFGTYDCEPTFWHLGVSSRVIDWIYANGFEKHARIPFPNPEIFKEPGVFPTHYMVSIAPFARQIGFQTTAEVGLTGFKHSSGKNN